MMQADSSPSIKSGSWQAWLLGARARTLPAAITPVVVGSAVALQQNLFAPGPALAALFGAVMIQIGANFANDVYDYERGTDTEARIGPTRVTQAGLLTPRQVRQGMVASFGLATLAGVYLTLIAGWPVVVIGLASIAAGVAYTAGPYPLSQLGLGDLFVMLFFGFVAVPGTVFVQAGFVPALAWPAALAVGSLTTVILVVNNVRDVETDREAGRRTIPVVFGRAAGVAELVILLVLAYAVALALPLTGQTRPGVLLAILTLPLAIRLARTVRSQRDGPTLNKELAASARLLLLYGLLFSLGLAAEWLLGAVSF